MSESTHYGKGDRPRKVDKDKFDSNWDKIFGKKLPTEKVDSGFKSSKKSDSK